MCLLSIGAKTCAILWIKTTVNRPQLKPFNPLFFSLLIVLYRKYIEMANINTTPKYLPNDLPVFLVIEYVCLARGLKSVTLLL